MNRDLNVELCQYCGKEINERCNCDMTQILHGNCIIGEGVIVIRGEKDGNER